MDDAGGLSARWVARSRRRAPCGHRRLSSAVMFRGPRGTVKSPLFRLRCAWCWPVGPRAPPTACPQGGRRRTGASSPCHRRSRSTGRDVSTCTSLHRHRRGQPSPLRPFAARCDSRFPPLGRVPQLPNCRRAMGTVIVGSSPRARRARGSTSGAERPSGRWLPGDRRGPRGRNGRARWAAREAC